MRLRIAVLVACGVLVFWNAIPAPFVLDDTNAVVRNETIRQLWPPSGPLQPPADTPVARRPLVNLTFALNYAYGGLDPRGYRAVNLLVHLLCALLLFAIVRRTIRHSAGLPGTDDVAWCVALVWMFHPLNSEVVDYVTQRSESLMALAYLATLYCAIRAWPAESAVQTPPIRRQRPKKGASPAPQSDRWWQAAAVCSCAAGVLCKESIVTAPVAVALYDRIFLFESWREAVRRRGGFYASLAATWALLAVVMWSGQRTSVGFGAGVSVQTYVLNQLRLIPHYLYLSVWPRSLVADYGLPQPLSPHDIVLPAVVLAGILAGAAILLARAPRLGFGVLFCFLALAPTSSFVPIATEVGAERRMYLPLAGLVATAVVAAWFLLRQVPARGRIALVTIVCVLAAAGTFARNREYVDSLELARTIATRWPSGRGHFYYGTELVAAGRREEAIAEFRRAAVDYPGGHYALGGELIDAGQTDEGLKELREFIRLAPSDIAVLPARDLIGRVLMTRGQFDAAAGEFSAILSRDPKNVRALVFLGDARWQQHRVAEAVASYEKARAIDPAAGGDGTVLGRLAMGLASEHRENEAIVAAQQAVAVTPENAALEKLLGQLLATRGRVADAVPHFRRAVDLAPGDAEARAFLAAAERQAGQSH